MCGVGKSGLIAAKISATLSSVGTPSFSLSASDSSHRDLGSISKKDVLILISYSGKTSELKNIKKISKSWEEKIGYVSQNIFLFNTSIKNNITMFSSKKKIDKKKLIIHLIKL